MEQREKYQETPIQELYEIARKNGIKHNDSMDKEEMIDLIIGFHEESKYKKPIDNEYSAKETSSSTK